MEYINIHGRLILEIETNIKVDIKLSIKVNF